MKTISKQLKNESVEYLQNYIDKEKRNRRLPKWKINKIKILIENKKKNLDDLANEIINSPLFKLANSEIIREGHVNKFKIDNKVKYEIPPAKTLLMMLKIVETANKQGQREKLNQYCEDFNVRKI